ncbi:cell division protein FtsQ [Deferribacter desulfuricans SSM1]|uniref:Cell division protein FtsQ n=1 Tax=Deferribacter desulfuricans (strain DSM 14783 / JCM 11476 / NBRC 101012 / SSM1) TaxID=639282 RepID=D3PBV8_DEFDS|nr:FtsQ-type POTRA domain-containing protein [Deferribacter desulfuricans]BAI80081.1 cell division protein FtsQ [Deferribacter desulfuricans SSM1]
MKKLVKLIFFTILVVILVIGVNKFTNSSFFKVRKIEVIGAINSNTKVVKKELKRLLDKNIFDIEDVQFVESDPWVTKCLITKRYPSTIVVKIYEKKAIFKFSKNGKCYFYLSDGSNLRTNCDNNRVKVIGNVDNIYFDEFANIFSKVDKNYKYLLYPSYFVVEYNGKPVKGFYEDNVFVANFNYLQKILDKGYKDFDYADIRLRNRIYISGVKRES